jgi:hypothetical protein
MTSSTSPVEVLGEGRATNWAQLSQGSLHAGGVKADGRIFTWGSNSSGQLGRGAIGSTSTPGQLSGNRTDWMSLAMGVGHSLAFRTDGSLWAWGSNASGQFGNNATGSSNVPVPSNFGDTPRARVTGSWTNPMGVSWSQTAPDTLTVVRTRNAQGAITSPVVNLSSETYGSIARVDFFNGSTSLASDTSAPFQATFTASGTGRHAFTARATDRVNTVAMSPVLNVEVFQLGEQVANATNPSVNLNTEGAVDWIHWGRSGTTAIGRPCTPFLTIAFQSTTALRFSSRSTAVPGFTWNYTGSGCSSSNTDPNTTRTGLKLAPWDYVTVEMPLSTTVRTVQIWVRVRNSQVLITPQTVNAGGFLAPFPETLSTSERHYVYTLTAAGPANGLPLGITIAHQFPSNADDREVVLQAIAVK